MNTFTEDVNISKLWRENNTNPYILQAYMVACDVVDGTHFHEYIGEYARLFCNNADIMISCKLGDIANNVGGTQLYDIVRCIVLMRAAAKDNPDWYNQRLAFTAPEYMRKAVELLNPLSGNADGIDIGVADTEPLFRSYLVTCIAASITETYIKSEAGNDVGFMRPLVLDVLSFYNARLHESLEGRADLLDARPKTLQELLDEIDIAYDALMKSKEADNADSTDN